MENNYAFIKSLLKRRYQTIAREIEEDIDAKLFGFDGIDPKHPTHEVLQNKKMVLDAEYKVFEESYELFERIFVESLKGSTPEDIQKCFIHILEKNNRALRFQISKMESQPLERINEEKLASLRKECQKNIIDLKYFKSLSLTDIEAIFKELVEKTSKNIPYDYKEVSTRDHFIYDVLNSGEYNKDFSRFLNTANSKIASSKIDFRETGIPEDRLALHFIAVKLAMPKEKYTTVSAEDMTNKSYSLSDINKMIDITDERWRDLQFGLYSDLSYYDIKECYNINREQDVSRVQKCENLIRRFNENGIISPELLEQFNSKKSYMKKLEKKHFLSAANQKELQDFYQLIRQIMSIIENKINEVYATVYGYLLHMDRPVTFETNYFLGHSDEIREMFKQYCDDLFKISSYLESSKEEILSSIRESALTFANSTPFTYLKGDEDWDISTIECLDICRKVYKSKLCDKFFEESNDIIKEINKIKRTNLGFSIKKIGN